MRRLVARRLVTSWLVTRRLALATSKSSSVLSVRTVRSATSSFSRRSSRSQSTAAGGDDSNASNRSTTASLTNRSNDPQFGHVTDSEATSNSRSTAWSRQFRHR